MPENAQSSGNFNRASANRFSLQQPFSAEWVRQQAGMMVGGIEADYFKSKRWFRSKLKEISGQQLLDLAITPVGPVLYALALVEVRYRDGGPEIYHLPLAFTPESGIPEAVRNQPRAVLAVLDTPAGAVIVHDAFADDEFCRYLYRAIYQSQTLPARAGEFRCVAVPRQFTRPDPGLVRRISGEQSNTSVIFGQEYIMKGFRKMEHGQNPDLEVPFFLTTTTGFSYVPKVDGYIEYHSHDHQVYSVGVLQDFVPNSGHGRQHALEELDLYFEKVANLTSSGGNPGAVAAQTAQSYAVAARRLGQITARMHLALASATPAQPEFVPQPITTADIEGWSGDITRLIGQVCGSIRAQLAGSAYEGTLRAQLEQVTAREQTYLSLVEGLQGLEQEQVSKIRFHGDYHLEQVLKTGDDFVILDFEGEPLRTLAERRARHCALKDIAGMLRSFAYAAYTGVFQAQEKWPAVPAQELEQWGLAWEEVARQAFLAGYFETTAGPSGGARFLPASAPVRAAVIRVFELEKAFYELNYEFNNRPGWVPIPVSGLVRISGAA